MTKICCSPVIMGHPSQCTREVISLRWPSPQASATLTDGGGSALDSRLSLLYPKQKSSAHLPHHSKDQAGRVAWQVLTRGTPLDHSCGRVAKLALERRRVQQRCPRGFSSAALGHRPQNPAKGADPRTGTPQRRNVFLPGCSVFSLSWPACAGAFLVPGPWCSGPAPSGSCLFGSASSFFLLAAGVTFQLPAGGTSGQAQRHRPKNRYRAPTQGPAFSGTFYVRLSCVPRVPDLFFPLHFAIYFPRMLWALQWLSSTPAAPYSVVQDKSSSPLRIFVALLEKHRLPWMEEVALDGLSFHSPRVQSNVCFIGCPCQSTCEALDFKRSH